MLIIGCDFHTRYQQIAMLDDGTGELIERRLEHESGEADRFYRGLPKPVRVGIEATGPLHWFERLLAELGHELWIGNSAKIRASEVRKQKTDERDVLRVAHAPVFEFQGGQRSVGERGAFWRWSSFAANCSFHSTASTSISISPRH